MVFLGGALFGMFVFGEAFPGIEELFYSTFMGDATLPSFFGISSGLIGFIIILMAVGMFVGGEWLEKKFSKEEA